MDFLTAFNNWCTGAGFWHGGGQGMTGMGSFGGWMPFHFGGIFQLLIIGLIIYFTVRLLRKPATNAGPEAPEDILKRRYAAGEIDIATYRSMKDELKTR